MRSLFSDVRFALRLLRRGPAFFATLLAILVAGIGATTAMFSIVESLLLAPLPYPHPEQLTMVWREDPRIHKGPTSIADFLDWRAQATTFEAMAATDYAAFSLSSDGATPEYVPGANVSGDFFRMLGNSPAAGRFFGPEDDRADGPKVAVLSAALWHRRFGSDPNVVGKVVTLDSQPYTVIGVAQDGFRLAGPNSSGVEVWTPLAVSFPGYADAVVNGRGNHFLNVIGRRKPGVSLEQGQAQLAQICERLQVAHPDSNAKMSVLLEDLHDALVGSSRSMVWVLFAAVALVFVIVCTNVAGLLLVRTQSRRAEMAARGALGATPRRLARQVLTETVVVFLLGSLGGWLCAHWLVDLFANGIVEAGRGGLATIDVRVDTVALLFSIGACLACGLAFGAIPAVAVARVEPQSVLKDSAARVTVGRTQQAVRSALVVTQIALACALLAGAGIAIEAFAKLAGTPPGFDPTNVATARISLPVAKYSDPDRVLAFYRDLLAKVSAQPGVQAVGANSELPMGGSNWNSSFELEGRPPFPHGESPILEQNVVTPGYFETMRIPLLRGRDVLDTDRAGGRAVLVVSESAAKRYFPGEDAIGHRISFDETEDGKPIWREIVGVVGDVRRRGLDEPIADECFLPVAQSPRGENVVPFLVARTARPEALLHALPGLVAEIDPRQAVASRMTMSQRVASSLASQRQVAILLAAFAAAALLLATLGVFGLVSYSTDQRRREIAIRMALGSTSAAAIGLVMKGGARLLAAGLAAGMVGALVVGRALATHIDGARAFDLPLYAVVAALLGAVGLLACLVPAWRAVRIPPASALRYE
jgi:putative ABC transport system permease protein